MLKNGYKSRVISPKSGAVACALYNSSPNSMDRMMENLVITEEEEEEEEDLVVDDTILSNANLCLVGRFVSGHTANFNLMRSRIASTWKPKKGIDIKDIGNGSTLPWLCFDDFNDLLSASDKRGRVAHPNWLLGGFRETILECGLSDIEIEGHPYTWSRGRGTDRFVEKRLDRTWGRHIATAWKMNKKDLENEISMLESKDDDASCDRYIVTKKELAKLLVLEEKHWK
ncbi:hypothetical protein ACS0TY_026827 [Phlomoides rotata]